MYQAHCYIDSDASGQYTASYDVNHVTPTIGIERMAPFLAWLKAKHAWGMIGEFGVPKNAPRYNVALENMLQYMQNNGLSGTYWHGGVWSGGDPLSCEPGSSYTVDAPQMAILQQFTQ